MGRDKGRERERDRRERTGEEGTRKGRESRERRQGEGRKGGSGREREGKISPPQSFLKVGACRTAIIKMVAKFDQADFPPQHCSLSV